MVLYFGETQKPSKIFKLQKRAIRLIANITRSTASCKPYFEKFQIMTVPCVCLCV
jgi:hypothetical protein